MGTGPESARCQSPFGQSLLVAIPHSPCRESDEEVLLCVRVGERDPAAVMEQAKAFGKVSLGDLGVIEPEGPESFEAVAERPGRRGGQGGQHAVPNPSGSAGQGQSPGGSILVVVGGAQVALGEPLDVVEDEA